MSFWHQLKSSLRGGLVQVQQFWVGKKLDANSLDAFEDRLIEADFGVKMSGRLRQNLARHKFSDKDPSSAEIESFLQQEISQLLQSCSASLSLEPKLEIILMVGVNGSGKTTTCAKLAHYFQQRGLKVLLAAGDTFRSAATEQLKLWAQKLKIDILARGHGFDSAALAFDAASKAQQEGFHRLIIDTAGRLHNNTNLMDELKKMVRVLQKIDPQFPHHCLLVLDGTVGQNAVQQVQQFQSFVQVSGLIMTKLDGSAKGGMLVQLSDEFSLPIYFLGMGETQDDLEVFSAEKFAQALVGA